MSFFFKNFILIGLILMAACTENTQELTDAQKNEVSTEVEASFGKLAEAAEALKTEQYLAFFDAKRHTALNEDGTVTHSLEDFATSYSQGIAHVKRYQSLEFTNVKITPINRTTAILVNEYTASVVLTSGEEVNVAGAGTQVWFKNDDVWKLVHVASSTKP